MVRVVLKVRYMMNVGVCKHDGLVFRCLKHVSAMLHLVFVCCCDFVSLVRILNMASELRSKLSKTVEAAPIRLPVGC